MTALPSRAIVLAAGRGQRLGPLGERGAKCLLRFGERTLLERHVSALRALGVPEIAVVVGYRQTDVEAALSALSGSAPDSAHVHAIRNPRFLEGSVVSLWQARERLLAGGDVLLLDADVLGPPVLLERLVARAGNLFLLDRKFDDREAEAVKLCVRGERLVEFRKQVDPALVRDYAGESVGFFRLDAAMARALAERCDAYVQAGRTGEPYEEAIRDLLLAAPERFGFCDVTGLPWIEIDFPDDVERARREILPQLGEAPRSQP
jgi:choline kinase